MTETTAVGFTKAEARQARRLGVVLAVTTAFVGLELFGAYLANSDVLRADAAHLLLDVVALALSLIAMRVAVREPNPRFTFGMRRVEPLVALLNGCVIVVVACIIVDESVEHLRGSGSVPVPTIMLVVAAAALVVHGFGAWLIHDAIGHAGHDDADHEGHDHAHHDHVGHHRGHALNLRAVWLHLAGDVLGAITALIAAIVIRLGGSPRIDSIGSLIVALILFFGAGKVIRDATLVLLDGTPPHLPVNTVREVVLAEPGVVAIAQLRVWSLGAGHDAVAVTVQVASLDATLAPRLRARLHHELGIELTIVELTPSA